MTRSGFSEFLVWISSILCLVYVSSASGYVPKDNYLIDCGSPTNTAVGDRVFSSDHFNSSLLTTPLDIPANIESSNSNLSSFDSVLYRTARIFNQTSYYTFPIRQHGRHWLRLYFYPFVDRNYNLSLAKFSVSVQNFTLIKKYQSDVRSVVKEYSLNVTSDSLVVRFVPAANSFAFVNALELFSLPVELTPGSVRTSQDIYQNLENKALETVQRVNMGNMSVSRRNDTLWRFWVSDDAYLQHGNLVTFVSNVSLVNFTDGGTTDVIAPALVYGSATQLNLLNEDFTIIANVTWHFEVDPGFDYLFRFHVCDIIKLPHSRIYFNVYIGSWLAFPNLDLLALTKNVQRAPYYMDVITGVGGSRLLNVTIGPAKMAVDPWAFLNGLEIMKISNSKNSLDVLDFVSSKSSKLKVILIVGLAVLLFVAILSAAIVFLLCRRRRKLAHIRNSKAEDDFHMDGGKYSGGIPLFSTPKFGYRFPFGVIQEATDNFSESLVLGVGGFGKVYRGALKDETLVAVKRGTSQSQGISEFRTEIEMLSQFRHRHLVSLIGYCDERNELIIIYEYMENGTLKDHLYGAENPSLSWNQRLEICIGAAKGLHYLHTGSTKAIIHRDVKSANILLDKNFMAKVADFGLSKTGPEIDQTHVSTAVKGSFGYLDPEYLIRQQLTEKSDVYSFGVVMLEVVCGRPVIDPTLRREKVNLVEWASKYQKSGKLEEIVDPCLEGQIKPDSLKKFGEIAEKCLAECGLNRPSMGDVLWNLECALQLQGNDERTNNQTPQMNHVSSFRSNASGAEFSTTVVGDLGGVSMSKVFAQMVAREDMR